MVQKCCHHITPYQDRHPSDVNNFDVRVRSALEKQNRKIRQMNYAPDVESAIEELNHIRNKVYTARDYGLPVEDKTVAAIEYSINLAMKKKDNLDTAMESTLNIPTSSYGHRSKYLETDICNMNRVARAFTNKPVDAIEFKCTEGASIINVIGLKDGKNVKNTTFALESSIDVPTASYLKRLVTSSNIKNLSFGDIHPTITAYVDGNRTRID